MLKRTSRYYLYPTSTLVVAAIVAFALCLSTKAAIISYRWSSNAGKSANGKAWPITMGTNTYCLTEWRFKINSLDAGSPAIVEAWGDDPLANGGVGAPKTLLGTFSHYSFDGGTKTAIYLPDAEIVFKANRKYWISTRPPDGVLTLYHDNAVPATSEVGATLNPPLLTGSWSTSPTTWTGQTSDIYQHQLSGEIYVPKGTVIMIQ